MIKLIVDSEIAEQLEESPGLLEICNQSGRTIGYFQPTLPPGSLSAMSPFSDEEIERRRKNRSGRPLRDILSDLDKA